MKALTFLILVLVISLSLVVVGCNPADDSTQGVDEAGEESSDVPAVESEDDTALLVEDGRYRGIYQDRGEEQVGVQFDIEDNVFTNISYRSLGYDGIDYLATEEGSPFYGITGQYEQVFEYLIGKPVSAIYDLYSPGDFVDDVDTFTGATIRSNKVLSAIKNGLDRGVYSY